MISRERLTTILGAVSRCRVVVIGDAMLDCYLLGDVERISPEAPVPVVSVHERRYALGGAANVAANAAALGADVAFVAVLGDDERGARARSLLASAGISDASVVAATGRQTTFKTRVVARGQQMVRVDEETDSPLEGAALNALVETAQRACEAADVVLLEDYNKGVLTPRVIDTVMRIATERGVPSVVDPKYRNFFAYAGATIFKPNRRELESALGAAVDLAHPDVLPLAIEKLGVQYLLLTLGAEGMVLAGRDGSLARIPTFAREVYDVSGAGDTATAWTGAALAAHASAAEAAEIANIAAGIEVGKFGVACVSRDEVLAFHDALRAGAPTPPYR